MPKLEFETTYDRIRELLYQEFEVDRGEIRPDMINKVQLLLDDIYDELLGRK